MLASIQEVISIESIMNADNIEAVGVLGWKVVCKKKEFKVGDLCVYVEIDSILPERSEFEFLRKGCWNNRYNGFRVFTIKLRGQISQGICFPLSILPTKAIKKVRKGMDVTEVLKVRKYEKPELNSAISFGSKITYAWYVRPIVKMIKRYSFLRKYFGKYIGLRDASDFPRFIPKTDEERLQSYPEIFENLKDKLFYVSMKMDGTSATYYYKDKIFGMCSRRIGIMRTKSKMYFQNNVYAEINIKYDIQNKLSKFGRNIALQGEICGPGIGGNKIGLNSLKFYLFNVFDIDAQRYVDYQEFINVANKLELITVPILKESVDFSDYTLENFLTMSEMSYDNHTPAEGIVVRSMVESMCSGLGRFSFKVLNNNFLLKYAE